MFDLKKLPPIERKADGSLPRMTGRQKQDAVRLIRHRCSAYDKGNCLYLDDGEEVVCPQSIAHCIFPDILAFYESEEGQREFAAWKAQRENERRLQDTKA